MLKQKQALAAPQLRRSQPGWKLLRGSQPFRPARHTCPGQGARAPMAPGRGPGCSSREAPQPPYPTPGQTVICRKVDVRAKRMRKPAVTPAAPAVWQVPALPRREGFRTR